MAMQSLKMGCHQSGMMQHESKHDSAVLSGSRHFKTDSESSASCQFCMPGVKMFAEILDHSSATWQSLCQWCQGAKARFRFRVSTPVIGCRCTHILHVEYVWLHLPYKAPGVVGKYKHQGSHLLRYVFLDRDHDTSWGGKDNLMGSVRSETWNIMKPWHIYPRGIQNSHLENQEKTSSKTIHRQVSIATLDSQTCSLS